jgi:L-fuculokinase
MMGSGVLEWIRSCFFSEIPQTDYDALERLGREVSPGSGGVAVLPSFVSDSGPNRQFGTKGTILGLGLHTGRAEVYRAALEGLSFQLRQALEILCTSTGLRPKGIRVVGGGSKNDLWNQIRADVTGLPITVTSQKQATVVGAAMVGFTGLGRFHSPESAMKSIEVRTTTILPGDASREYGARYENYLRVAPGLKSFYRASCRRAAQ